LESKTGPGSFTKWPKILPGKRNYIYPECGKSSVLEISKTSVLRALSFSNIILSVRVIKRGRKEDLGKHYTKNFREEV
jgi:hypothetical protein